MDTTMTTADEESARLVARLAPRLRGAYRLPQYRQPDVRWQNAPACSPPPRIVSDTLQ
jgi:hypothetical protein